MTVKNIISSSSTSISSDIKSKINTISQCHEGTEIILQEKKEEKENRDDVIEQYEILHQQEHSYQTKDYLSYIISPSTPDTQQQQKHHKPINEKCRYSMTKWCYKILNFYNHSPQELTYIAMSHVDRFLCTAQGQFILNNRKWFQLAVMCCLQLAMKVHESKKLHVDELIALGRGTFTVEEMIEMEREIIFALKFRLCPVTPFQFLDFFVMDLGCSLSDNGFVTERVLEAARCQIHVASLRYSLSVLVKPSMIALAALLNAIDKDVAIGRDRSNLEECNEEWNLFLKQVNKITGISPSGNSIYALRLKLTQYVGMEDTSPEG